MIPGSRTVKKKKGGTFSKEFLLVSTENEQLLSVCPLKKKGKNSRVLSVQILGGFLRSLHQNS